jgi:hypothetical protein
VLVFGLTAFKAFSMPWARPSLASTSTLWYTFVRDGVLYFACVACARDPSLLCRPTPLIPGRSAIFAVNLANIMMLLFTHVRPFPLHSLSSLPNFNARPQPALKAAGSLGTTSLSAVLAARLLLNIRRASSTYNDSDENSRESGDVELSLVMLSEDASAVGGVG